MARETKIEVARKLLLDKVGKHLKKDVLSLLSENGCAKDIYYALVKSGCIRNLSVEFCDITDLIKTMSNDEVSKFRYPTKIFKNQEKICIKETHKRNRELLQRHGAIVSKEVLIKNMDESKFKNGEDVSDILDIETENAIKLLKNIGYRVLKPVTNFEEM